MAKITNLNEYKQSKTYRLLINIGDKVRLRAGLSQNIGIVMKLLDHERYYIKWPSGLHTYETSTSLIKE